MKHVKWSFFENSYWLRTLHHRCLKWFWIRLQLSIEGWLKVVSYCQRTLQLIFRIWFLSEMLVVWFPQGSFIKYLREIFLCILQVLFSSKAPCFFRFQLFSGSYLDHRHPWSFNQGWKKLVSHLSFILGVTNISHQGENKFAIYFPKCFTGKARFICTYRII